MHNMVSFILLLTLFIAPSTQTWTLEKLAQGQDNLFQRLSEIGGNQARLQTLLRAANAETAEIKAEDLEQYQVVLAHIEDLDNQSADIKELLTIVGATQNATSQLLAELDTLRGRQAVSAAVQVGQVLMFVAYLLTTISIYFVKRCQKVREKTQRKEFELLEKKLLSNKAKRRAAAAKAKSAPAPSQE